MEPNTSSQSISTNYEEEHDVSNLIDDFVGLDVTKCEPVNNATIVFFSLDTSERNTKNSEILQIAAGCKGNNGEIHKFNVYMMPEIYGIAPSTSVNKGYKIGYNNRKQLLLDENEVVARTQKQGLELFLDFLSEQCGEGGSVLLATHSCYQVRRPVLLRHMAKHTLLPRCQELVSRFIDILAVAKTELEGRVTDFSLENLERTYLHGNTLQRPLADVTVKVLMTLNVNPGFTDNILVTYARAFDYDLYSLKYDFKNHVALSVLEVIARAGISSTRLQTEHRDNNGDVSNLLRALVVQNVIDIINARLLAMANIN